MCIQNKNIIDNGCNILQVECSRGLCRLFVLTLAPYFWFNDTPPFSRIFCEYLNKRRIVYVCRREKVKFNPLDMVSCRWIVRLTLPKDIFNEPIIHQK